ncbi:MAG: hypothetical protein AAF559_13535 [Pseudomonadota bacterium]
MTAFPARPFGVARTALVSIGVAFSFPVAAQSPANGTQETGAEASEETNLAQGPVLIEFEGLRDLVGAASRNRLLSQKLGYTLRVDATGALNACELARRFRRKATRLALCRPLLNTMTFEPARDAAGEPVEGIYEGVIDFQMWMKGDGHLKDH